MYYFQKFYNIATKMSINELNQYYNKNEDFNTLIYGLNDNEKNNYNLSSNINFISSYSKLIPNSNSSVVFPLSFDNNSIFSNTERIPINNKLQKNIFKKKIKIFENNFDKDNIEMFMKNSSLTNRNINKNNIRRKGKNRRTYSYGNLEVKKDNEAYQMFNNQNNNIFNNSNIINNTHSLKAIFPTYTISSPNGLFYPIIFTNNNDNYLNNNILYNYQENMPINSAFSTKAKQKPSLWLANICSPTNQMPIIQNNNLTSPKYFNKSANLNSFPININNYSEDYLNKQIYDFINANTKEKQNIIKNISKKHNFKLNRSNGAIKINDQNKPINNNYLNKSIKKKNKSYYTMNIEESSQIFSDNITNELSIDTSYNINNKSSNNKILKNGNENNDINYMINSNDIRSKNQLLKNKKSQNLKMSHLESSNNNINNRYNGNNNIRKPKISNKIITNNCSIEINNKEFIKEKDISNRSNEKSINYNNIGKDNSLKTPNQENYLHNGYSFNNNYKSTNSIKKAKNKYNKNLINSKSSNKDCNQNKLKIYNNINKKSKNSNLVKKDKINFNIQNFSKEAFNPKKSNNIPNRNISISTINSNENKRLYDPSLYEVSNTVNEEFINIDNFEEKQESNINDDNSLEMSLQSVNDSKMLELANRYVEEGKGLDKNKINEILNDKTAQKIMKNYK